MRPHFRLRGLRAVQITIAIIMLAAPASALALSSTHAQASASRGPSDTLTTHVTPRQVALGAPVQVAGHTTPQAAGDTVELETSAGRGAPWRRLATTRIGRHGGWAVRVHLRQSATLRAVEVVGATSRSQVTGPAARFPTAATAAAHPAAVSRPTRVAVRAQLRVAARAVSMLAGRGAPLDGHLLPARAGRTVTVQAHVGRGWRTIGRSRTGGHGGFSVHLAPVSGTGHRLRAVFAGDRHNAGTTGSAGELTVYTPAVVSWYDDAGSNACGFHAAYGVANKTLPCGTKVRFRRGGRTVTATVDDRGPYVAGREYDLAGPTAGALGFAGVGTLETSVG